jgi:hypothetical protein
MSDIDADHRQIAVDKLKAGSDYTFRLTPIATADDSQLALLLDVTMPMAEHDTRSLTCACGTMATQPHLVCLVFQCLVVRHEPKRSSSLSARLSIGEIDDVLPSDDLSSQFVDETFDVDARTDDNDDPLTQVSR